jgi:hypothetical protein
MTTQENSPVFHGGLCACAICIYKKRKEKQPGSISEHARHKNETTKKISLQAVEL